MRRPRLFALLALLICSLAARGAPGGSQVGGRTSPDGTEEIQVDLPGGQHLKNAAGIDGSGLCVFTSIEIAGRWQNVAELQGFQEKMKHEPGGGYPEKVDAMMRKYAPHVRYVQYTGKDPSMIRLALKTGRAACLTYGYSPRYGQRIAHMVDCVHYSDRWAAVLDNNFPGEDRYEWMSPEELQRRWQMGGGGWLVVLLDPGPPPVPINPTSYHWPSGRVITGWGQRGCGPVGPLMQPPVYMPAPVLLNPGRGGCCSDQCVCGCNDGGDCPCTGRKAPPPPPAPKPEVPPAPVPKVEAPPERPANFGVDRSRLPEGECCTVCGIPVSTALGRRLVAGGGTLDDDSGRWHLTVIGTETECVPVLRDLASHPALATWRDRLLVQAYRAADWAVANIGLATHGHPSIVVQTAPDAHGRGTVLHRQEDYQGGAEALAEALRHADPNYRPEADPDRRQAPVVPTGDSASRPFWIINGVLGALLALSLWRKRS